MEYQKKKNSPMGIIMSSPALRKQMRDAWYAPAGSTKRAQSRAAARAIIKIGQRKGIYDGQGGFADTVSNFFTTPFASAADTKETTARRSLGQYTPEEINYRSNSEPGMLSRFSNRWSQANTRVNEALNSVKSDPGVWGAVKGFAKNRARGAAVSTQESLSMISDIPSAFMKSIDNILHPDSAEGIGELLVSEIAKVISGKSADPKDMARLATKSAKEVADYYRLKAQESGYQRPSGTAINLQLPTPGATTQVVTEAEQLGQTDAPAEVQQKLTVMDHVASIFESDRPAYLASLDQNSREVAEKMLEYLDAGFSKDMAVSSVMNDIDMLKKMFPGMPEDKLPIGGFASEALYNARQAMMKQYDLKGQYDKLFDMKARGYTIEQDLIDYIKSQDSYIGTIDQLLKREKGLLTGAGASDVRKMQSNLYTTWLTKMKGKQEARYISWIDKSMKAYETSYNIAKDTFDKTSAWIESELKALEPVTTDRYNMYQKYIGGMYDQLGLMSTNSENYMAALKTKTDTATSIVNGVTAMDAALEPYPKARAAMRAATGLDTEMASPSGRLTWGLDSKSLAKADLSDVEARKVYGDYDEKTGQMKVHLDDPIQAIERGVSRGLHPEAVFNWWLEDVESDIYSQSAFSAADNGFNDAVLKKYEGIMENIKASPEYLSGNKEYEYIVNRMNNVIYDKYFGAVENELFKADAQDPSVAAASAEKRANIVKFIKGLKKLDPNEIVLPDGNINKDALKKVINRGWLLPAINTGSVDTPGNINGIINQIWAAYSYYVQQAIDVGADIVDLGEIMKEAFPTTEKDPNTGAEVEMSEADIVDKALYLLRTLYKTDAERYENYKNLYIEGEEGGEAAAENQ